MTFWSLIALALRLAGLARWADLFYEKHRQQADAQAVADAPSTKPELERTLEDGGL